MTKGKVKRQFATVYWTAEDVKSLHPRWSLARCEEELGEIERRIADRMSEAGWGVLECLLPRD